MALHHLKPKLNNGKRFRYHLSFQNIILHLSLLYFNISDEKETHVIINSVSIKSPENRCTRFSIDNVKSLEKKCFICNEIRECDANILREGGLGRVDTQDVPHRD